MIGWMQNWDPFLRMEDAGWFGQMSLPRAFQKDGPADPAADPEINALRTNEVIMRMKLSQE